MAQDVVLEFVVRSDGSVGEICHTGRGDEKLVDSVHGYLATCRFKPSVRGPDNPIAVKMIVPFAPFALGLFSRMRRADC